MALFPRLLWLLAAAALLAGAALAQDPPSPKAKPKPKGVLLTVQEALDLAFPKAVVEREAVYLSKAERKRLDELAGAKTGQAILHPYRAYAAPDKPGGKRGKLLGTAWFDTHKVRTLRETVMVVVDPAGKVARIEVLAFAEPKKYLPRAKWFAQFVGRELGPGLSLQKDIRGIAGATLSCRAATDAVRRCLAGHRMAQEQAAAEAKRREEAKRKREAEGGKGGGTRP